MGYWRVETCNCIIVNAIGVDKNSVLFWSFMHDWYENFTQSILIISSSLTKGIEKRMKLVKKIEIIIFKHIILY